MTPRQGGAEFESSRVMTEMKYMRDFGEGVDRMYREMETMGMPTPVYEEYAFMLRVTLRNNLETRQLRQVTNLSQDERAANLNERQQRAFYFLQNKGRITLRDYLDLNPGTPDRTARYDLKILVDLKMIKPVGGRKGRSYIWIES
jgi:ATP-dependent DNA helicase RecG